MISLFATEKRNAKRERLGNPLKMLAQAIDFATRASAAVYAKLVIGGSDRGDRLPYAAALMIQRLVVQQLCNLFGDALESPGWIGPASGASRGWRRPAASGRQDGRGVA